MSGSASGSRHVVGIDIGGANLKYCDTSGHAISKIFPLWQTPELLADTLASGLREFPQCSELAVTMTGELADCFIDRRIGVSTIVDHAAQAASQIGANLVRFYGTDGQFRSSGDAKASCGAIAAANWHALASFAARSFPTATTVIDIGSTTTDIIPVSNSRVATKAMTDYDRMVEGSLVYVGCRRTPICSVVDRLPYRGQQCPVMNELFATIDDALLVLQLVAEDVTDLDTADGQPRTLKFAANRLARMIGLDHTGVSIGDAQRMASEVVDIVANRIDAAFRKVHRSGSVVVAGHGDDLLRIDPTVSVNRLSDHIGHGAARCAPSYAVAMLYQWQAQDAGVRCDG